MNSEILEQWAKMGKNLTGPVGDLNRAGTEMCRRVAQQNLDMMSENFSRLADQLKRFSDVRKPEDFFHLQKECINEDVTATIENAQKIVRTTMENIEEFTKLCSSVQEPIINATAKAGEKFEREREKHHK